MEKLGWNGPVKKYLQVTISEFLESLKEHNQRNMLCNPSIQQIRAWENEYQILKRELPLLVKNNEQAKEWYLVFEYELPRERGRRPDILVIADDRIFIIECKDMKKPEQQHIDQLKAYVRDLQNYHSGSAGVKFVPLLLMTLMNNERIEAKEVTIISPNYLHFELDVKSQSKTIDAQDWITSRYAPLPSLIAAAKMIFQHEPLPRIRKAESLGVNDAVNSLLEITTQSLKNGEKHLALVTGVPGSGKTLVGLQLVYKLQDNDDVPVGVFLSGNGPLVKVLQHTLKNKVFVQDVHGFLKEYGGNSNHTPKEKVIVFDEAQRAWDADHVKEKRGVDVSEPLDFLRIGAKKEGGTLMVGLIGEGQEIHLGEESGLIQWNDAIIESNEEWIVHCPSKISNLFSGAKRVETNEDLNLNATLRSHLAEDVDKWVEALLAGDFNLAQEYALNVEDENFNIYVTRDIDVAKRYVTERYNECEDKLYGFVCSAKAKNLSKYGIDNDFYAMQRFNVGSWFNDEPTSPKSCCSFNLPTTEFQCQGLELDFPIVCWGDDLHWEDGWKRRGRIRYKSKDPLKVTLNCYRVLLTRGRDGMVIFVPDLDTKNTFDALVAAGAKVLYGFEISDGVSEEMVGVAALEIDKIP